MAFRETHDIIRDEQKLADFVDWLPDLQLNQKYFLALFARKKYMTVIKSSDKTQLKRLTANKEDIIRKIRQLECPVGSFTTKDGTVIPDEGLVLYIMPNPRCMLKSSFLLIKEMLKCIEHNNEYINPHAEAISCMQRSKGKSFVVHFDIDDGRAEQVYPIVKDIVGDAFDILQTRGGCHLLVHPKKVTIKGNWHCEIVKRLAEFDIDQTGDLMMPIPGCVQGGFVPSFYQEKK